MSYLIRSREDLAKLKQLAESKKLLRGERLKQKLGKQDFHYDMKEVFEPVTDLQSKAIESTAEASSKIEKQVKALQDGTQQYNFITNVDESNTVDPNIVKTVANLLNDKNKSQFSIEPVDEQTPNIFTINPSNPQTVLISGSTITFENGNNYDLTVPEISNFLTNTQIKKIEDPDIKDALYNFLLDMKYDINDGDKRSSRYKVIKKLLHREDVEGSGLVIVFLPSDPNELVDRLQLLYQEKLGGNDNPQLDQEITAIIDKLLEYGCITSGQHSNILQQI